MRRGHPWLVARPLWNEILNMRSPQSPRNFLNAHSKEIEYVEMDNSRTLEDLDTPEDYRRYLMNSYREAFRLWGTPVRVEFRSEDNPFAERRNKLTPRQRRTKQRDERRR